MEERSCDYHVMFVRLCDCHVMFFFHTTFSEYVIYMYVT